MTLLAPTAALLAAGLTLPVLLAFYLLKLRRRPVRVSATYLWAQALRELQVNIPFRWLRPSWLLLLHLVILGLLITAAGRPAIPVPGLSAPRVIILIDRSASMSARDVITGAETRSRLDEAKARARRLLDDLFAGGGPRSAAIVAFASEPRDLTGFTTDPGRLRLALDELTPTDQPGDLAAALRLIDAMTSSAASDDQDGPEPPPVIILSDGSFAGGAPLPGLAAPIRYIPIGPADADAPSAAGRTPDGHANLGIVALAARRDYDNPAILRVFARIQNASAQPRSAGLALSANAQVIARRPVVVPGAQPPADNPGGPLQFGQATASFEVQTGESALIALTIDDSDVLEADNAAAMVVNAAARPRVLLVVPDADLASGSLLEDNLAEMRLAALRKLGAGDFDAASPADLGAFDLVIFDRVTPRRIPPIASLSMGAGPPIPGLTLIPTPDARSATYFLSWDRNHPVMRGVAPDTVIVAHPSTLTYTSPEAGAAGFTEIARGSAGPLIALLESGRARHLVLAFDPAESTWPLQPGYTVFLASAIDYLTLQGEASAGRAFTTAAAARIPLPAGPPARLALTGPATLSVDVPPGLSPGDEFSVGRIERAGVYRIEGAPAGPQGLVCINLLDETESGLRVEPAMEISGRPVRPYAAEQSSREVWPWFIAAAAALLVIEWFLYAFRMRV
ncbi:MAG: VWA domain-containing protein [Phycisphaerales bacterium]|nr:VWA domain-containing protein [Phycisphaerales bacterium]